MTGVVLVDAGRSAIIPDDPGLPDLPAGLVEDVIAALLRRSCLDPSEVAELFLADPRHLPAGSSPGPSGTGVAGPLGLPTTLATSSSLSMAQAVRTIEDNPDVVAVVAAADPGPSHPAAGGAAHPRLRQHTAGIVAAWWDIAPDEMAAWARSSYTRSAECLAAGDFADEIVSTTAGYLVDCYRKPQVGDRFTGRVSDGAAPADDGPAVIAHPARGASAILLAAESTAVELGLPVRARLHASRTVRSACEFGIAPLGAGGVDELLIPGGFSIGCLDQLEVPEHCAVTPVAWMKETGISEYLLNPRGGDLGFGHLPRSGDLRSLVTMVNSLADTGGRFGALVASDIRWTTVFVLATQ
ncbi:MAG: hypothetical protein J2P18_09770 [Nocardia sp.]|nr:hypothetical protein [Nocardia sp.]